MLTEFGFVLFYYAVFLLVKHGLDCEECCDSPRDLRDLAPIVVYVTLQLVVCLNLFHELAFASTP